MANWIKAWAFTSAWEGGFDGEKKSDPLPFDDLTAVWGLTPRFLVDYNGSSIANATNKTKFRNISKATAAAIWFKTRWKWFKCANITNEGLSILVFDGAVRRGNAFAQILCDVVNMPQTDKSIKNAILPPLAVINALNAASSDVYLSIVTNYIENHAPHKKGSVVLEAKVSGVIRRMACLYFRRFDLTPDTFKDPSLKGSLTYAQRVDYEDAVAKMAGFTIQRPNRLTANRVKTDDDVLPEWGKWLTGAVAVWAGGKLFKWW